MKGATPLTPTKASKKDENDWQAEDDSRTLVRAEEIKADKARLKRALAKVKEQSAALEKVTANG